MANMESRPFDRTIGDAFTDAVIEVHNASRPVQKALGWKLELSDSDVGNEPEGALDTALQAFLYAGEAMPEAIRELTAQLLAELDPTDDLDKRMIDTFEVIKAR